jgi:sec-independent protein translocase protein TatA
MPNIGAPELAIILVIVLVIFGPKRLPGLGKQLGTGMREFKDSITGSTKEKDEDEAAPEPTAAAPREVARTAPAEPEVLTGEARHEDELARRGGS